MHATHENSRACLDEMADALSARGRAVHAVLCRSAFPVTDRQVMRALGFVEPNAVRPRITELIAEGWAEEVGAMKCRETGKSVRLVRGLPVRRREVNQLTLL